MNLLETVSSFAQTVEKAAFEAAMIERLKEEPYTMSDLLYAVYKCQRDIEALASSIVVIADSLNKVGSSKKLSQPSRKKKK